MANGNGALPLDPRSAEVNNYGVRGEPIHFTPTQKRILAILYDGLPHHRTELQACLTDELADPLKVARHIYELRKLLKPRGHTIDCIVRDHKFWYKHVRVLHGDYLIKY